MAPTNRKITPEELQKLSQQVKKYFADKSDALRTDINSWLATHNLSQSNDEISASYLAVQLQAANVSDDEISRILGKYLEQEAQDVVDFIKAEEYSAKLCEEIERFKQIYWAVHPPKDIEGINTKIIQKLKEHRFSYYEEGGKVQNFQKSESLINKQDIREIIQKKYNELEAVLDNKDASQINQKLKDVFGLEIEQQSITMSDIKAVVREKFEQVYKEVAQIISKGIKTDQTLQNILKAQLKSGFDQLGITGDFNTEFIIQTKLEEKIKKHIRTQKLKQVKKYAYALDFELNSRKVQKISENSDANAIIQAFSGTALIKYLSDSKTKAEESLNINLEGAKKYYDFLSEKEHIQNILDKASQEDASRLDNVLRAIVSDQTYQQIILDGAKSYAAKRLAINIDVKKIDNEFAVHIQELSRKSGHGAENNHTIPVSVFLKALEHRLASKKFSDGSDLLEYVKDFYGPDYPNNPHYRSVKSYIEQQVESVIGKADFELLVRDQIIGSIYKNWNERLYATYVEKRDLRGEGNAIQDGILKELKDTYNKNSVTKKNLNKIYSEYLAAIDIQRIDIDVQNKASFEMLDYVVRDAIWLEKIILKNFQEKFQDKAYVQNYKNDLIDNYSAFGKQLIKVRLSSQGINNKKAEKFENAWLAHAQNHKFFDANVPGSIFSPYQSDGDQDYSNRRGEMRLHNENMERINANIKAILLHELKGKNIDVDLELERGVERSDGTPKKANTSSKQVERIRAKLKQDIDARTEERFYAIGAISNAEEVTSAAIIRILKKEKHLKYISSH